MKIAGTFISWRGPAGPGETNSSGCGWNSTCFTRAAPLLAEQLRRNMSTKRAGPHGGAWWLREGVLAMVFVFAQVGFYPPGGPDMTSSGVTPVCS